MNIIQLYTRTDNDPDFEVTTAPYTYKDITVPEGFRFDGASTPRLFWSIIPPFKRTKKAACIHDYLCSVAKNSADRDKADEIFKEMLTEVAKLNSFRVQVGYWGVRLGKLFGAGVHY